MRERIRTTKRSVYKGKTDIHLLTTIATNNSQRILTGRLTNSASTVLPNSTPLTYFTNYMPFYYAYAIIFIIFPAIIALCFWLYKAYTADQSTKDYSSGKLIIRDSKSRFILVVMLINLFSWNSILASPVALSIDNIRGPTLESNHFEIVPMINNSNVTTSGILYNTNSSITTSLMTTESTTECYPWYYLLTNFWFWVLIIVPLLSLVLCDCILGGMATGACKIFLVLVLMAALTIVYAVIMSL